MKTMVAARQVAKAFRAACKVHGEGTREEADAVRAALPLLSDCIS